MRQASTRTTLSRFWPSVVVAVILAVAALPPAHAQTFSVVHTFSWTDGSVPNGDLIRDGAGNLYGTTQIGGNSGLGVVFKLDSSGNETVLYSFTGGTDGAFPFGRLVRDKNGNLYGMTSYQGDPTCACGTVFQLKPDGTLVVLHAFLGGTDGMQNVGQPGVGLLPVGNELYGVTYFGGTTGCDGDLGCGTIFKITPRGEETVLYRFSGAADGGFPQDLIQDAAGNLYGVTEASYDISSANGGVFKLDAGGQFSVFYNFPGGAGGSTPHWRLTAGANNILYGTTISGGSPDCPLGPCGVIYSLDTQTATETVLHSFGVLRDDGTEPSGALLNASGDLFGTTYYGGITNGLCTLGCGIVYGSATNGTYRVLYQFTGGADGSNPNGALVQGSEGSVYGAAAIGGNDDNGVIFKISRQ